MGVRVCSNFRRSIKCSCWESIMDSPMKAYWTARCLGTAHLPTLYNRMPRVFFGLTTNRALQSLRCNASQSKCRTLKRNASILFYLLSIFYSSCYWLISYVIQQISWVLGFYFSRWKAYLCWGNLSSLIRTYLRHFWGLPAEEAFEVFETIGIAILWNHWNMTTIIW